MANRTKPTRVFAFTQKVIRMLVRARGRLLASHCGENIEMEKPLTRASSFFLWLWLAWNLFCTPGWPQLTDIHPLLPPKC